MCLEEVCLRKSKAHYKLKREIKILISEVTCPIQGLMVDIVSRHL
jgi:hypothetical protein